MSQSIAPPEAGLYKRIGLRVGWAFFALVGVTYGAQLLAQVLVAALEPQMTEYPLWLTWLLSFAPLYCVGMPVFVTLLQPLPGIRPPRQRTGAGWLLGTVCVAIVAMYAGALVGNGLNWLIGALRGRPVLSGLEKVVGTAPLWQTFLFACVLAPVGEELLFNFLLEKTLVFGEKKAALFCALAFGMFHGNLYQFFYAFLLRLVLVRLRLHTGHVGWCIALHAIINVMGGVVSSWAVTQPEPVVAAYGLVLLGLIAAGCVVLARRRGSVRWALPRPEARTVRLFGTPGALLAWVCCGLLFLLSLVQKSPG